MNELKEYIDRLLESPTYRGWHLTQADTITHDSIVAALNGILKLQNSDGVFNGNEANLQKLSLIMGRGGKDLPIRKQVLVNLDALGFIERIGKGESLIIKVTDMGRYYLSYSNKNFYMDDFLSKYELKKERVGFNINAYPMVINVLQNVDISGKISFEEFMYFVSQITGPEDIKEKISLIKLYRALTPKEKKEFDVYIQGKCEQMTQLAIKRGSPKYTKRENGTLENYLRDYGNWRNNAKHSLEFISLGSKIAVLPNYEIVLNIGTDAFRTQIIEDIKKLKQEIKVETQQQKHLRNIQIVNNLKELYDYFCQFCGYNYERIPTKYGYYVEVHHIKPVADVIDMIESGEIEEGFEIDDPKNLVVVCPNHHKMLHRHYPPFKQEIVTFDKGRIGIETVDKIKRLILTLNQHL